jgi:hypothetical protein
MRPPPRNVGSMKLYKSREHPDRWIGEDEHGNLMVWPVEPGGWAKRTAWTGAKRQLEEVSPALARGTRWPGAGRARKPRSATGEPSTHRLTLRATGDEMAAWERRAADEGKPLSTWGRDTLNAELARPRSKAKP